jgi:GPH family glycoside/pentoside/hexuronide:cation symporter
MLYYTDSAGISAGFIGTMMLVSRILDGASDIAMGVVIEKTHTRWGKARPWLLFFCVPFALSLVLLFNVPQSLGVVYKHTYIYASYIFMAAICYTAVNLAYNALLPRFSLTSHDRNIVSAFRGIAVIITALGISLATPPLLEAFGGQQSQGAWSKLAAIYASISLVMLIVTFLGVKERVPLDSEGKTAQVPIGKALSTLARNKHFYLATAMFVVFYCINGVGGVGIYYARDVLGNAGYFGVLSLASILPMLVAIPILPSVYKKFGKRNAMLVGALASAAGCLLQLLKPDSLPLYLAFALLRGLGSITFSMSIFTLASDIVEADEKKHGFRAEGLVTSANSFGMKVGTGIGSGMVGWMLALGGYNALAEKQAGSAISAMITLQIGIPAVLSLMLALLLAFWNLERKVS